MTTTGSFERNTEDDMIERRSHAIVIGQVQGILIVGEEAGLVYWRGKYDAVHP